MQVIEGYAPLTAEQLQGALYGVMTERQRKVFEEDLELDFAYAVPGPRPLPRQRLPAARVARRGDAR